MKKLLLLILFPLSTQAEEFYIQDDLANMVEDVVRTTRLKINIPDMASKYVRIDQVDGMNVCTPEAKQKVLKLQAAFSKHPTLLRTKSIHGAYLRQANGRIRYIPFEEIGAKMNNKCEYISVSVK